MAVMAVSGFGVLQAYHAYEVGKTALLAENVEALSNLEGDDDDEGCQRSEPIFVYSEMCPLCNTQPYTRGTKYWCGVSNSAKKCKSGNHTDYYSCSCTRNPPVQGERPSSASCSSTSK